MTQIRNGLQKWHPGSTVFILTSRKTEIAKSAIEPRLRWLFAQGEMAKTVPQTDKYGDVISADHKFLNEGGESRDHHRYAVVVQDFGNSMDAMLSVQNEKFSGDGKEFTKVSRTVGKANSHLHRQLTEIWKIL